MRNGYNIVFRASHQYLIIYKIRGKLNQLEMEKSHVIQHVHTFTSIIVPLSNEAILTRPSAIVGVVSRWLFDPGVPADLGEIDVELFQIAATIYPSIVDTPAFPLYLSPGIHLDEWPIFVDRSDRHAVLLPVPSRTP